MASVALAALCACAADEALPPAIDAADIDAPDLDARDTDAPDTDAAPADAPAPDGRPIDAVPPIDAPALPLSEAWTHCTADATFGALGAAASGGVAYTHWHHMTSPFALRSPGITSLAADRSVIQAWTASGEGLPGGVAVTGTVAVGTACQFGGSFCSLVWLDGTAPPPSSSGGNGLDEAIRGPVATPPGITFAWQTRLYRVDANRQPLASFGTGGTLELGASFAFAATSGGANLVVLTGDTLQLRSATTGALVPTFGTAGTVDLPLGPGRRWLAAGPTGEIVVAHLAPTPSPHLELTPISATGAVATTVVTTLPAAIAVALHGDRAVVLEPTTDSNLRLTVLDLPTAAATPVIKYACTGCVLGPGDLAIAPDGRIYAGYSTAASACVMGLNP